MRTSRKGSVARLMLRGDGTHDTRDELHDQDDRAGQDTAGRGPFAVPGHLGLLFIKDAHRTVTMSRLAPETAALDRAPRFIHCMVSQ